MEKYIKENGITNELRGEQYYPLTRRNSGFTFVFSSPKGALKNILSRNPTTTTKKFVDTQHLRCYNKIIRLPLEFS